MEEFSEVKNRDRKLSKPLLPDDVPKSSTESLQEVQERERDTADFKKSLETSPGNRFFLHMKISVLIFFCCVVGYIVGVMKLSALYLFIVCYAGSFVYNRKVEHFTRSLRSLVYHNTMKERVRSDGETAEWLNYIMKKLWGVSEPIVSAKIYQQVNSELLKVTPPFLNELRLEEFTLGSRPPLIERIWHIDMDGNTLALEADAAFIPLETNKDAAKYFEGKEISWDSKIKLLARVGTRNGIRISLPILVKEFFFRGRIRIVVSLIQKNVFIKDIDVCLMSEPEFDFTLVPLRTVDIMDVPGLSKWIRKMINTIACAKVVNPNSVTVNIDTISKDKGKVIGVVCLQVLNLENESNERLSAEIDVDGRVGYQTKYCEGIGIVYNEHFYITVEDVDTRIGLSFRGEQKNTKRRNGWIFIKDLPLHRIRELHTDDAPGPRRTFFNKARLVKDEQAYSFVNTNLQFYPVQAGKSNSGIIRMMLVGIEDLQGNRTSRMQTYSTFCTVIVSPINSDESSVPVGFVENTVSMTALIVSGVVNTAGSVITNIVPGLETVTSKLLPSSSSTFYVFESRRVFGSNSPMYNDEFCFFCRDITEDVVSVCVMNDRTNEVIGRVSVPVRDINFGKSEKYKLNDAQGGRIELVFYIDHVDMTDKEAGFVPYERVLKVSVDSVNEKGNYYVVFETSTDCFNMDTFTAAPLIKKAFYVPLQANDTLRLVLYKETINGDVFIGDDHVDCKPVSGVRRDAFLFGKQVSVTLSVEEKALKDYTGAPEERGFMKVIQVRFGRFHGHTQEMFIEFWDDKEVIKASGFTRNGELNDTFTFIPGCSQIHAIVKSGNQSDNTVLGRCVIPERFLMEKVVLNEIGLSVDMEVRVQSCSYKPLQTLKVGFLEVYIKNGKEVRSVGDGSPDTYCRILVNENKVYQTKVVRRSKDPVFNESFIMEVNRTKDIVGIQIYNHNAPERNALLSCTEFSLHNLCEGFSEMELCLSDGRTFQPTESKIRLGFNFCADHSALRVKKKGIIGEFFGF